MPRLEAEGFRYYSVREWLEHGSPLDRPFLVERHSKNHPLQGIAHDGAEAFVETYLNGLCQLIIEVAEGYCAELEGYGYIIESAPFYSPVLPLRQYKYNSHTFSVAMIEAQTFAVGAYVTILSAQQEDEEDTCQG